MIMYMIVSLTSFVTMDATSYHLGLHESF